MLPSFKLGVNFASNGAWDSHVQGVAEKILNQLHNTLSNGISNCVCVCV